LLPALLLTLASTPSPPQAEAAPARPYVSGIYPHLALYNDENECGIGGVVEWAGRLWVITYAPHAPRGSTDRLYSIGRELELVVHPESVGGTAACRMIHRETQQLVLGPYVIDARGKVRVITPERMPGRLTAVARHLREPERKVYFATMEEGLYEVDLATLEVVELYADDQGQLRGRAHGRKVAELPGYHGKGLYSGQGRLVYANNGEPGAAAQRSPGVQSGCLAEWDGDAWRVVRRNQFTEVTGPGSLYGNADAERDPVWSIGWDHRSLILMVLDAGRWHAYRLPKASHAYDGAHGWNTEWPRIRDVGEPALLMTMHGAFWSFPREFSAGRSAGVVPLSTYLKVVGDFARFGERLVLGCDDVARSEFLNRRRAKGELAGPGQSHSNLWFLDPAALTRLGPPLGRGAVWLDEPVAAETWSEPYLFDGFPRRGVHLASDAPAPVTFRFELDRAGDGRWSPFREVRVPAGGYVWHAFAPEARGAWIRVSLDRAVAHATAAFHAAGPDPRTTTPAPIFASLATRDEPRRIGGLLRARGDGRGTLAVVAAALDGAKAEELGFYELTPALTLEPRDDPAALAWHRAHIALPAGVLSADAASLVYVDDDGERWRLPRGPAPLDASPARLCREVVTERDLFHAGGTFYELPARNAGGFAKLRPIATHPYRVHDYAAFRGLLVMTGLRADAPEAPADPHVVRSSDRRAAVWVGAVDDLWSLGKPRGSGGPWLATPARAGEPSDPYLLTGFDEKTLRLEHDAEQAVTFTLEVDITGTGQWHAWRRFAVPPDRVVRDAFPPGFGAYWLRAVVDRDCRATVQLRYR